MPLDRVEDFPLAELIASRRRELDLSLSETASLMRKADRRCGATPQAVHEYEKGRIPHPAGRRCLAIALDLPLVRVTEPAEAQRMKRRQALRSALALGGALVLPPAAARLVSQDERVAYALESRGRLDTVTISDMGAVTAAYRRAYRQLSARTLTPQVEGQRGVLGELLRCSGKPALRDQLVVTLGETEALLACMLFLDLGNFDQASFHLSQGLAAARQTDARELEAFILGGMTFHASYSGDQPSSLRLIQHAREVAGTAATPTTRGWLAAIDAEMQARAGNARGALAALEDAESALQAVDDADSQWIGIGVFNKAKLTSYAGLCYVLLQQPRKAVDELTGALRSLDPTMAKHRCTAMADLATALIHLREVEEGCRIASDSLALAIELRHTVNADRIRRLRPRLEPWKGHPAVRSLDDQLQLVARW